MTTYNFNVNYTESGQLASSAQSLVVYDQLVAELLMNGANAGTTFTETTGRVVSRFGNAQTSTAFKDEGTASLLCDGTGDYLTIPDTLDIRAQGDFRVECWIRQATISTIRTICTKRPVSGTTAEFSFLQDGTGKLSMVTWDVAGNLALQITDPTAMVINTGYSVAVWRVAATGLWGIERDGVTVVTGTEAAAPGVNTSSPMYIGRDPTATGRDWNGYIDRWRFLRA